MENRVLSLEYFEKKTERHISEMKHNMETMSQDVTAIKNAVIGNELNGNSGIVPDMKVLKLKLDDVEKRLAEHTIYFRQMAWAIGILATFIVGLVVAMFK